MAIQQGMSQQTPAVQSLLSVLRGGVRRAVKRRVKRTAKKAIRKVARSASSKGAKFVKGSAAAKRHMAKLRKMRKS